MFLTLRRQIKEKYPNFHRPISRFKRRVEWLLVWWVKPKELVYFFKHSTKAIKEAKKYPPLRELPITREVS